MSSARARRIARSARPAPSFAMRMGVDAGLAPGRPAVSLAAALDTFPSAGGNAGATYQRQSAAGVDSLVSVLAGVPRSDQHVLANGRLAAGSCVEAGAQNVILQSDDLDTTWTKVGLTSISANGANASDGQATLDGLVSTAVDAVHGVTQVCTATAVEWCLQAEVKAGNQPWVVFEDKTLEGWTSLGRLGTETYAWELCAIGNQLYASSCISVGTVWRYDGGTTWTSIGRPGGDATWALSLFPIGSDLYCGCTGGANSLGHVFKYAGGTSWTDLGRCGAETWIFALHAIGSQLYAGSYPNGTVWRYDGGTAWTSIGRCGTSTYVWSLHAVGSQLYAGTGSAAGVVYRYDGGTTWTSIGQCGTELFVKAICDVGGQLYCITNPTATVWRYDGGSTWNSIGRLGSDTDGEALVNLGNQLYAGAASPSGVVYRYDGGTTWTSIGRCGTETGIQSLCFIGSQLYAGTTPGGNVYRYDGAYAFFNPATRAWGQVGNKIKDKWILRDAADSVKAIGVKIDGTAAAHTLGLYSAPSDGVRNFTGDAAAANAWAGKIQFAAEDAPSSPINTTTAAVTRAADSPLRYSGVAHFGAGCGALFFRFSGLAFTLLRSHYLVTCYKAGSASTDYISVYVDTSGRVNVASAATAGAAGAVQASGNKCDGDVHEVVIAWSKNLLRLWVDKVEATPDTACDFNSAMDTIDIGTDNAGANHAAPGIIVNDFRMCPRPVDSAIIQPSGFFPIG